MIKYMYLLALLLCSHILIAQNYPTITNERPRVEINNQRFDVLKKLLSDTKTERVDSIYGSLKEGSDMRSYWLCGKTKGINLCGDPNLWKWDWTEIDIYEALIGLKLILLDFNITEGDNRALQKERILFISNTLIDRISFLESTIDYENLQQNNTEELKKDFRVLARLGSVFFDWGYDALKQPNNETFQTARMAIANGLFNLNDNYMKYFIYNTYFGEYISNNYYTGGHILQDHIINLRLLITLYGAPELLPAQQLELEEKYHLIYDNIENNLLPVHEFYALDDPTSNFSEDNGGTHWGGVYTLSARQMLLEYFNLVTAATNTNLFTTDPWINNIAKQHYYLIAPDFYSLNFGDGIVDFRYLGNDWSIVPLFNNFSEVINNDLMRLYEQNNDKNPKNLTEELLLRDFSKTVAYEKNFEPKDTWFSERTGLLIYKSSLKENATMIGLVNAPTNLNNNHQHRDNNSFQIYKNGPLFVDSGVYDYYPSFHYMNYYSRTIAHNTITVYDPDEKFLDHVNDGGQLLKKSLYNLNQIENDYDTDAWVNYSNEDEFIYSVTDASYSYNYKKVDYYERKFLNLKDKNRVIILDIVKQPRKRNPFQTNFNVHLQNKPVIYDDSNTDDLLENKDDGIYIFKDINSYFIFNDTGGNAVLKTLSPTSNTAAIIGGPNYKYYVVDNTGGKNITVPESYETSNRRRVANWRIEVRANPERRKNKYIFLNTIAIGDDENPAQNLSQYLSNIDNTIALVWDREVYAFHNRSARFRLKKHEIDISSLFNVHTVYAFDLLPGKLYKVSIDGKEVTAVYSNEKGAVKLSNINLDGALLEIKK